eukprot:SM000100S09445  [mRNA]  locus=s100:499116:502989:+ [translate_table: standard]
MLAATAVSSATWRTAAAAAAPLRSPPAVAPSQAESLRAVAKAMAGLAPLEQYRRLAALQATDEVAFYRLLAADLPRWLPIVYTPTVGDACLEFGTLSPRPRTLVVSRYDDTADRLDAALAAWPQGSDIRVAVITDGERVLGLGDLGAHGAGIVFGKAVVYVAAGLHPNQVLPIALDVGTNNVRLREDPSYIGLREERLRGQQYYDLVDMLVGALQRRYGWNVIIHWEDVGVSSSFDLLKKYGRSTLTFNDDIQSTAAIALAGVLAALRITGNDIASQKFILLGAGQHAVQAGIGIARLLCTALEEHGLSTYEALEHIALLDSKGLIYDGRSALISDLKQPFALRGLPQALVDPTSLRACVTALQPSVLIGVAAAPGAFNHEVIKAMSSANVRPIIFALSNPLSKCECTAEEAYVWSGGQAIFASGTQFPPVTLGNKTFEPGFANNAFIFPGISLGVISSGAQRIKDQMFYEAAVALSRMVDQTDLDIGCAYPPTSKLKEAAVQVAEAIASNVEVANMTPSPCAAALTTDSSQSLNSLDECIRGILYDPFLPSEQSPVY